MQYFIQKQKSYLSYFKTSLYYILPIFYRFNVKATVNHDLSTSSNVITKSITSIRICALKYLEKENNNNNNTAAVLYSAIVHVTIDLLKLLK